MNTKVKILLLALAVSFLAVSSVATAQTDPAIVGRWTSVPNLPFYPVHLHVLPTGEVMIWPGNSISGNDPRLWDPTTNAVTLLAQPGYDVFCSGHSFLTDGRLFVTGGHIATNSGLPKASIYNPFTDTWSTVPNMNAGRWYPTNTTLADGNVLVLSGNMESGIMNPLPQVFQTQTNTWRDLTNAQLSLDQYPRMHLAPNGQVFNSSPTTVTRYINTAGTGSWSVVANRNLYRDYGTSILYDNGKVLLTGGGDPPTATSEVIDLTAASPAWRPVASMAFNRRQHNATILPDGKVFVNGGTSGPGFNDLTKPVYASEIWDPATENWTTTASQLIPRLYHSASVLLPDGRVLTTGGNDQFEAEIYEPPYLFKGARPTISSAPANVSYGETFFVGAPNAAGITQVTLIRLSSTTHSFNMEQRISRLGFSQAAGGLNVAAPAGANLTPGGYYLLFILNGSGVPSVGKIIRLTSGAGGPPVVPTLTSLSPNNTTAGGPSFSLTVNGTNFVVGSVVQWNGTTRSTTFVSTTQLTAAISASDIAIGGAASVSVVNPAPTGGTSNALTFVINTVSATAGLVAAYSFDEGTGTAVIDSSGNGNGGTIASATWVSGGKFGGALSFNGVSSMVTVPSSVSFNFTDALTISAWVSPTAIGGWRNVIMKERTGMEIYSLYANTSTNVPQVFVYRSASPTSADFASGTGQMPLNTWTHLAATYDGTAVRLYVNGTQVGSKAATGPILTSTGALRIGGDSLWGEFFQGLIDEVRIYNRALNQAEIQSDMNTPVGPQGPDITPPDTSIIAFPANPTNNASASFGFTSTETGSTFQCQMDGAGFVACASPQNFAGLANGSHTFQVRAVDPAGNIDSTPASYAWTIDTVVPAVSMTSPTDGVTVSNSATLSANASDNSAVAGVQFKVDGVNLAAEIPAAPYSMTWNTTATSNGPHSLTAVARDAAGNSAVSAAVQITVANTIDSVKPSTPTGLTATVISASQINLSWTAATDNIGVTGYRVYRNGAQVTEINSTSYSDTGLLASTAYSYRVSARDAAGNESAQSAAASATTSASPAGLVAAYSFNAGAGTTVSDASGHGLTGTITSATWTNTGKYGAALSFNGIDSWVTVPSSGSFNFTTAMTLSAWVFPTSIGGWRTVILKERGNVEAYSLYANTSTNVSRVVVYRTASPNSADIASSTSQLPLNTWTHLAATYDGSTLRLYVNGSLASSKSAPGSLLSSTGALRIGGNGIWGEFFQGLIDEVRIYNRVLTVAQIKSDMSTLIQ